MMMLNLSNHFRILKAWLLLETSHDKWVGLQFSQWGGVFSDMYATLTRALCCMNLYGRITALFIWWLSSCHGVTSLCQVNVLLVENENFLLCFQFPNVCQIGKDYGKYGQWVYVITVKVIIVTWLCLVICGLIWKSEIVGFRDRDKWGMSDLGS